MCILRGICNVHIINICQANIVLRKQYHNLCCTKQEYSNSIFKFNKAITFNFTVHITYNTKCNTFPYIMAALYNVTVKAQIDFIII